MESKNYVNLFKIAKILFYIFITLFNFYLDQWVLFKANKY
jgi:hypothetical protein